MPSSSRRRGCRRAASPRRGTPASGPTSGVRPRGDAGPRMTFFPDCRTPRRPAPRPWRRPAAVPRRGQGDLRREDGDAGRAADVVGAVGVDDRRGARHLRGIGDAGVANVGLRGVVRRLLVEPAQLLVSVLARSRSRARWAGVLRVSIQGQPAGTAARAAAEVAGDADAGALIAAVAGTTANAATAGRATARRRRRDGSGISPPERHGEQRERPGPADQVGTRTVD